MGSFNSVHRINKTYQIKMKSTNLLPLVSFYFNNFGNSKVIGGNCNPDVEVCLCLFGDQFTGLCKLSGDRSLEIGNGDSPIVPVVEPTDACTDIVCDAFSTTGDCEVTKSGYQCTCNLGFDFNGDWQTTNADSCNPTPTAIDHCVGVTCDATTIGICVSSDIGFQCQCQIGFNYKGDTKTTNATHCKPNKVVVDTTTEAPQTDIVDPVIPDVENTDCKESESDVFRGNVATTVSGYTCQRWDAGIDSTIDVVHNPSFRPEKINHNYCRNPSDHTNEWCYTTNPNKRWDNCEIPVCGAPAPVIPEVEDTDCKKSESEVYRGNVATTVSGYTCQRWDAGIDSKIDVVHNPSFRPVNINHNYCRNPSGHTNEWCYTTNP